MIDVSKDLDEIYLEFDIDNWEQGSVPKDNMPDSYITFWEEPSFDNLNVDNRTKEIVYPFTIIYYTKEWDTLSDIFENIVSLLKSKNYIVDGMGFPIDSGIDGYKARCIEVQKIERRN